MIYEKPFFQDQEKSHRCSLLSLLSNILLEILAMAIRQGKKRHPNWNRRSKTFGRCNDIICIKTLKTKSVTSNESRMNGYSAIKKKHTHKEILPFATTWIGT